MRFTKKEKNGGRPRSVLPYLALISTNILFLVFERLGLLGSTGPILALFMLAFVFAYLIKEFHESREHLLSYFYQVFYFVGLLVSALLISNGAYMIEIQKFGNPNGSFWLLVIFFISGYEVSRLAYYKCIKYLAASESPSIDKRIERVVMLTITFAVIALSLFILVRYSSPVLLKMERSTFWGGVVPASYSFIPTLVLQTFFLAISLRWVRPSSRKSQVLAACIVFLYIFVTIFVLGHKLSALIIYIMVFLTFIGAHNPGFKIKTRAVIALTTAIVALYLLVVFSYGNIGRDSSFILTRLALQSQLVWSVLDTLYFPLTSSAPWACYWGCSGLESGSDFISSEFLPSKLFYHYKDSGAGLSGFLPALPVFTFGSVVAFILHIAFSIFGGGLQAYLVLQVRKYNVIYGFLIYKIHFAIVLFWYTGLALGRFFVLSVILCVSLQLLSRHFRKYR